MCSEWLKTCLTPNCSELLCTSEALRWMLVLYQLQEAKRASGFLNDTYRKTWVMFDVYNWQQDQENIPETEQEIINSWQEGKQLGRNVPEKQCSSPNPSALLLTFCCSAPATLFLSQSESPVCFADSLLRMRFVSSRTELTVLLLDHWLWNS